MERNLKQKAEMMAANAARRQTWKRLIILPAALVALFTTSMLISPALAFAGEPACGKEEHAHSDACYERVLTCTEPTDAVEGEAGPEAAHVHTDACYTKELTCTLEEHAHDESCYAAKPAPQSEEKAQDGTAPEPVCGLAEHAHTEDCYDETGVLTCGLDEHTHDETCLPKPEPENPEDPGDTATSETAAPETAAEPTEDAVTPETATPETATPETAEKAGPKTLEVTDHNVRISVTFGPEAGLPDNVQLVATEITPASDPDQFDSFVAQAEETLGESIAPVAAADEPAAIDLEEEAETPALPMLLYNIGFYADGVEVEPQAPVAVTVQFLDAEGFPVGDEMSVLHFAADGVEQLANQTSAENNTASFTAGSFSPFAFFQQASEAAENEEKKEEEEEKKQPDAEVKTGSDTAEDDEKKPGTVTDGAEDKETDTKEDKEEEGKEEKKEDAGAKTPAAYTPVNGFDLGFVTMANETPMTESDLADDLAKGSATLKNGITVTSTITISSSATLDLNGHIINYTGSGSLFKVEGGTFTVKDTASKDLKPVDRGAVDTSGDNSFFVGEYAGIYTPTQGNSAVDGWLASWDGTTLTYYVTTPVADIPGRTEGVIVGTTDTRRMYTVDLSNAGALTANGQTLIEVTGGSVEIKGGRLTSANGRAINVPTSGSAINVTISGGYLCGNGKTQGTEADYKPYNDGKTHNGTYYPAKEEKINCGDDFDGGAIYYNADGTLEISGSAVLAANRAWNGGAVYVGRKSGLIWDQKFRATVRVSGDAVISGNLAVGAGSSNDFDNYPGWGGGGLYVASADHLYIQDNAYITNNYASGSKHGDINTDTGLLLGCNDQGGGGIFFTGSGTVDMSGGYITGNRAWNVGGGMAIREDYSDQGGKLKVTNGFISSNVANFREGGGVWMSSYVDATVQAAAGCKVYITNNETHTVRDWGGGALFVHGESGRLTMYRTLITDNTAEGFGGGVGGCSTGRLFVSGNGKTGPNEGAAIYENTAKGVQTTASLKDDDHTAAQLQEFIDSGNYQDYFSALVSRVTGTMLGGGFARWVGSIDYHHIEFTSEEQVETASLMAGLTNYADEAAKRAAEQNAAVFMSGNTSSMHGGAIMCNGILQFGDDVDTSYTLGFEVNGVKGLYKSGAEQAMNVGQFTFKLVRTDSSFTPYNAGSKDAQEFTTTNYSQDGKFSISVDEFPGVDTLQPNNYKTYYYKLSEVNSGETGIGYDDAYYKITVQVRRLDYTENIGGSETDDPKYTVFKVTRIDVVYVDGDNEQTLWEDDDNNDIKYDYAEKFTWWYNNPSNTTQYRLRATLSLHPRNSMTKNGHAGKAFVNTGTRSPMLYILKQNAETGAAMPGVTFTLENNTTKVQQKGTTQQGMYNQGVVGFKVENGQSYTLTEERGTANAYYKKAGPWNVEVDNSGNITITSQTAGDEEVTSQTQKIDDSAYLVTVHVIKNVPKEIVALPETGGSGTAAYTVSGLGLLLLAAWVWRRRHAGAVSR